MLRLLTRFQGRRRLKRTLIAASFAVAVLPAQAQTAREKYDLQERCGRRAAEVFAKEWGTGFTAKATANYENHYSSRLNKCFYLITTNAQGIQMMGLFDLNENKGDCPGRC
jgi:hypothetical protein